MNKLMSLLSSLPEPAMIINGDMSIMYQNERARNAFGDQAGESCHRALEDADKPCEGCPATRTFRDGAYHLAMIEPKPAAVKRRCRPYSATPVKDPHDKVSECVLFFRDVAGLKESDRRKDDQLSMLSHDLKSPMTVIHSYADLLLERSPCIDDEGRQILGRIKKSAMKYSRLLDDFLTLSRIEAGKLALCLRPGSLAEVAALCADDMLVLAMEKNITILTDLPCGLPEVNIDERHCGRLVTNIIENALKYSGEGGRVWIRAGVEEDRKKVYVELSDEGPGIPEDELPLIMEKYYRSDSAGKPHGMGLGLAIVKALAELHGGSVEIKNRAGRGATVKVSLPAVPASISPSTP